MIYTERPNDCTETLPQVVACYVVCEDTVLLLQRQPHKPHGGTWGLPAGKVDAGESREQAVLREVFEETGIRVDPANFVALAPLWVQHDGHEFEYYSFLVRFSEKPEVTLSPQEHQQFAWVTDAEMHSLNLIHDLLECNKVLLQR